MLVNGNSLLGKRPIANMVDAKVREHGVSYGLGEAGYDIRLKQEIAFKPSNMGPIIYKNGEIIHGRFVIASAVEEFNMPDTLVGIVHDKSTWAREGISVFNTVIEPGWRGFLTLEIVFHGSKDIVLPAGCGIAQVLFHRVTDEVTYNGKYQDQPDAPVAPRYEGIQSLATKQR